MTERGQPSGNKQRRTGEFMNHADRRGAKRRHDGQHRTPGVVLDPLAEVRGGMFMSVIVCGRQRMVNLQGRGKRRKDDQDHGHRDGKEHSSRSPG